MVVFNLRGMENGGQIKAYVLRDMTGKDLCSAQIQSVQRMGGAVIPYKVLLDWPSEKLKLTGTAGAVLASAGVEANFNVILTWRRHETNGTAASGG